jgi:hypothetical protein
VNKRALLPSVLLVSACGDPQLTLNLVVDNDNYRNLLTSVDLQIIEPPAASPFTCDDIAFGKVDPNVVQLSKVGEVSATETRTAISDISRTHAKLFIADGFSDAKQRLVTGCAAVGTISQDVMVVINAEPVVVVTPPMNTSLSTPRGQPLQNAVVVSVKDVLGNALGDIQANWSIEGAAGAGSTGMASSDSGGNISLHPDLPSRPGPFVLDIRVRWADPQAAVDLSGFVRADATPVMLTAHATAYASGAIGPNKEKGVAALVADGVGAKVALIYGSSSTKLSDHIDGTSLQLGVIDHAGAARDQVIVVGDGGSWVEVDANAGVHGMAYVAPAGFSPTKVFTMSDCAGGAPQVMIELVQGSVVTGGAVDFAIYPSGGGPAAMGPYSIPQDQGAFELLASGCVSDQNMTQRRMWLLGGTGFGLTALLAGPDVQKLLAAAWLAIPEGLAFSPAIGDQRLVFGTQLSMNDIVVSRATADVESNSLKLDIIGSDAVPGLPLFTAAGDIDGDGVVDVVSLIQRPQAMNSMTTQHAMWAALGRQHDNKRIRGDVDLADTNLRSPQLLVVDLDGDNVDDIFVGEVVGAADIAPSKAVVYFMGK